MVAFPFGGRRGLAYVVLGTGAVLLHGCGGDKTTTTTTTTTTNKPVSKCKAGQAAGDAGCLCGADKPVKCKSGQFCLKDDQSTGKCEVTCTLGHVDKCAGACTKSDDSPCQEGDTDCFCPPKMEDTTTTSTTTTTTPETTTPPSTSQHRVCKNANGMCAFPFQEKKGEEYIYECLPRKISGHWCADKVDDDRVQSHWINCDPSSDCKMVPDTCSGCHADATCQTSESSDVCVCKQGFTGDGHDCQPDTKEMIA